MSGGWGSLRDGIENHFKGSKLAVQQVHKPMLWTSSFLSLKVSYGPLYIHDNGFGSIGPKTIPTQYVW